MVENLARVHYELTIEQHDELEQLLIDTIYQNRKNTAPNLDILFDVLTIAVNAYVDTISPDRRFGM